MRIEGHTTEGMQQTTRSTIEKLTKRNCD